MVSRPEELRKQVNEIWKQTVDQLEHLKKTLLHSADRFEADIDRLRRERDRVLKQLSQNTHRLANQAKVPMPAWVKEAVDKLNGAIDKVVEKSPNSKKKKRTNTSKPRARSARKSPKRSAR